MGRHYPVTRRAERAPVVVLSVLLVVALAGWFTFDFLTDKLGASNCESITTVTLSAAPDVAPAIAQVARKRSADDCYQVRVSAIESAGFAVERVRSFELGPSWSHTNPHVLGLARSPGASEA